MNRIALVGALGVIASVATFAGSAHAAPLYSFETVDKYEVQAGRIYVTGLVTGDTAASTRELPFGTTTANSNNDRTAIGCERMLTLSFNKPGKFRVKYTSLNGASGYCSIERR
jgi:hypothetical protein